MWRAVGRFLDRTLGRLLCVATIHAPDKTYSLNWGPLLTARGPHGRIYQEFWPCRRCNAVYRKRIRRQPHLKVGRRPP